MKPSLRIHEAALRLGVSVDTLREWDRSGRLRAQRTPGGQRFYLADDVDAFRRRGDAVRPRSTKRAPVDVENSGDEFEMLTTDDPESRWLQEQARQEEKQRRHSERAAELQRILSLKQFGLAHFARQACDLPSDLVGNARGEVTRAMEEYVTPRRFPSWAQADHGGQQLAQQEVVARVDEILASFRDEAASARDRERIEGLVAYAGRCLEGRAVLLPLEAHRDFRRDVLEAVDDEIAADWTESDVQALVERVLQEWTSGEEPDEPDERDADDEEGNESDADEFPAADADDDGEGWDDDEDDEASDEEDSDDDESEDDED